MPQITKAHFYITQILDHVAGCYLLHELLDRDDSIDSDLANLIGVLIIHSDHISLDLIASNQWRRAIS